MRSVLAHAIYSIRAVHTKYGPRYIAEIQLLGETKKDFWLSPKQGEKLAQCFEKLQEHGGYSTKHAEVHIILDNGEKGERFVWCGVHTGKRSDFDFLEQKFGVKCESPYIGRVDASICEADESLVDK
ncbi:MAG: hypothetical protein ACRDCT_11300 [Shewanella sp.]